MADDKQGAPTSKATKAADAADRPGLRRVGGTSGGGGEFVVGLGLLALGAWLFISRINVQAWGSGGGRGGVPTAWALIPLFLGVALLFFNSRSRAGWLAIALGFGWLVVGVLARAHFVFARTSMGMTVLTLVCIAGGLGLIFRAIRSHG